MKIITVSSNTDNPGHLQLKRSLDHFGYDYHVIIHPFEFGRQMKVIYEWCKANWGWFLYTDAWDTFALGKMPQLPECQMLISTEKACYPHPEWAARYPANDSPWKYVNGGGFVTTCEYFVKIYEDGSHQTESNDQAWLAEQFLKRQDEIKLDYECRVFQTIAFEAEDDFEYLTNIAPKNKWEGMLFNKVTHSFPVFIHGNGHTDMKHIYRLL